MMKEQIKNSIVLKEGQMSLYVKSLRISSNMIMFIWDGQLENFQGTTLVISRFNARQTKTD